MHIGCLFYVVASLDLFRNVWKFLVPKFFCHVAGFIPILSFLMLLQEHYFLKLFFRLFTVSLHKCSQFQYADFVSVTLLNILTTKGF